LLLLRRILRWGTRRLIRAFRLFHHNLHSKKLAPLKLWHRAITRSLKPAAGALRTFIYQNAYYSIALALNDQPNATGAGPQYASSHLHSNGPSQGKLSPLIPSTGTNYRRLNLGFNTASQLRILLRSKFFRCMADTALLLTVEMCGRSRDSPQIVNDLPAPWHLPCCSQIQCATGQPFAARSTVRILQSNRLAPPEARQLVECAAS